MIKQHNSRLLKYDKVIAQLQSQVDKLTTKNKKLERELQSMQMIN